MRQIKFRAWDGQNIVYPDSSGFYVVRVFGFDAPVYLKVGDILNTNGITPMQFTGKVDKNGKEIYEGDLVQVEAGISGASSNDCRPMIGQVIYENHGFSGFTIKLWHEKSWWAYGYLKSQTAEVIGNIYEHPNLLK